MGSVLSLGNSSSGLTDDGALPNPNQNLTLWDMMIHLFKRYVVSKVENDEFLCAYLLNNDHKLTFLRMGQRAITYEPANLPSRVVYDEKYERRARELDRRAEIRSHQKFRSKFHSSPNTPSNSSYNTTYPMIAHPKIEETYYEETSSSEEDFEQSTSEYSSSEEDIILSSAPNPNDNKLKMYAFYSKLDNSPPVNNL